MIARGALFFACACAVTGAARANKVIAECWEYEDTIRAAMQLADAGQREVALSATEDLDFANINIDCHSHVREFRAKLLRSQGRRDDALEEYLAIFDRDPQWRPVDASAEEEDFIEAVRTQWLQVNPIGLRVSPRAIDLATSPPGGVELELTHDPRFILRWRVKNKPDWVDVTKHGGRTEEGAAFTRVVLREPGVLGRPGVVELECRPWGEVQVPVFGFEGAPIAGEVETEPELTRFSADRSGPPMWLRVLGGVAVAGGAGYVAFALIDGDDEPDEPIVPFELPEPPDPPDETKIRFSWRFR